MLIARVADHCFWFGRYLARVESTARGLDKARETVIGAELDDGASWLPAIIAAGEQARFSERFAANPEAAEDEELVQGYLVWDPQNPTSLANSVQALRSNARSIRDHLSEEVWSEINGLHLWLAGDDARRQFAEDSPAFYGEVVRSVALVSGLLRSTMLRVEPLEFIVLGSMIELANQTARVLDVQHHVLAGRVAGRAQSSTSQELGSMGQDMGAGGMSQQMGGMSQQLGGMSPPPGSASPPREVGEAIVDTARWLTLLRACGGYEAFMRRHRGRVGARAVAAFLIQDPRFPRSIGFALDAALGRLRAIRAVGEDGEAGPGERSQARLEALLRWLQALEPEALAGAEVHAALTRVVDETHAICDEIGVELLGH